MQQFGYATVLAQSQTPEGQIEANPAQPSFAAGSACTVLASFFDNTGAAMVPSVLAYQIMDVLTGEIILEQTTIENPQSVQQILVTAEQNEIISNSSNSETHELVLFITDPSSRGPFAAWCRFDLMALPVP